MDAFQKYLIMATMAAIKNQMTAPLGTSAMQPARMQKWEVLLLLTVETLNEAFTWKRD